ncbi:MAG: translocated intimin receptor Tir [Acidobacteria bacterium]|nr:MAG: translocated intimin receptor Tir [Acidobacteriota bacterium]
MKRSLPRLVLSDPHFWIPFAVLLFGIAVLVTITKGA